MLAATPLLGTPAGTFGFVAPGCAPGPRTPSWDVPRVGTLCVAPRGWKKKGGSSSAPKDPGRGGCVSWDVVGTQIWGGGQSAGLHPQTSPQIGVAESWGAGGQQGVVWGRGGVPVRLL